MELPQRDGPAVLVVLIILLLFVALHGLLFT
jgi:hypothetical protein